LIVLSDGESLINPGEPNKKFIQELAGLLVKIHEKTPVAVVTGGGVPSRKCAKAVKELGGSQFLSDEAAVLSTRQNALLLIAALGEHAWPSVPTNFDEAACACCHRILVMGGTIPGITTDTDCALLAEMTRAKRIVNASNVDGIYTADPKKDRSAKKLNKLSFEQMLELASKSDRRVAGENFVFDVIACKIIARSRIETHFVGQDIGDIESAILGKKHSGTVVGDD